MKVRDDVCKGTKKKKKVRDDIYKGTKQKKVRTMYIKEQKNEGKGRCV